MARFLLRDTTTSELTIITGDVPLNAEPLAPVGTYAVSALSDLEAETNLVIQVPTLSNPVDVADGDTAATGSVDTDGINGTLYWVVSTSGTAPSAAQVKAGQDHTGSAAADSGSQSVSASGTQTLSPAPSGLTAETAYTIHFMHEAASANQSTVASGDGFTTEAAGASKSVLVGDSETGSGTTSGTLTLGTHDAASRIFVTVIAGGAGMVNSGFAVGSGTATLVQRVSWTNRVVECWEITGLSGSSVNYTVTTTDTFVAAFRTVGYTPIATDPVKANRQDSSNTNPTTLDTPSIPAGGAALIHVKRYESLTGPTGMVLTFDEGTGGAAHIAGYFENSGGSADTTDYVGSTTEATSAKYLAVVTLEEV